VRILSIAKIQTLSEPDCYGFRQHCGVFGPFFALRQRAEIAGDGGVVQRDMLEGLLSQPPPLLEGDGARPQRVEHRAVVVRVHHDQHVGEVLGRRPHHGRAADVDVLRASRSPRPSTPSPRRGRVDGHQVDGLEAGGQLFQVLRPVAPGGCAVDAGSVFTRPSKISGNPVSSERLRTGTPADARAPWVPPVL
jgi:hypothetical protein